jgi:hypothetical protein
MSGLTSSAARVRPMAKIDFGSMNRALDALRGPVRESLARRMLAAATKKVELEAKVRAKQNPRPRGVFNDRGSSASSMAPGTLSDAIYGAFDKKKSTETFFQYNVSWNASKAWWGKLKEFGWLQTDVIVYFEDSGQFSTLKGRRLAQPIRHPAQPFLAPAFDSTSPLLLGIMTNVGKRELPKLLREHTHAS